MFKVDSDEHLFYGTLQGDESFSKNKCLEKELPQWCVVILVPTLLCAYPLALASLR